MKKFLPALLLAALAVFPPLGLAQSGYRLIKKIPIPGDAQWDYVSVDDVNRRVYVSHGTEVVVLDADSGEIMGKIPAPTPAPSNTSTSQPVHGAAIAPDLGRGFTSNGRTNNSTIFDLKTLKPLGEVPAGDSPDGFMYDPGTHRVFIFNGHSKDVTVIDGAQGKVAGTISMGGKPEAATADGKGHAFVNIEDRDLILKLDTKKLLVEDRWKTDPCHEPASMAIDPARQRLFVGCRNKLLTVLSTEDGHIITTLPIGAGTDSAAYDPERRLVFSSNGDGTLTIIQQESPDNYSVVEDVKTEPGARTMALDLKTHKLFLSLADRVTPPPAAPGQPASRRGAGIVPGSFRVLVVARE